MRIIKGARFYPDIEFRKVWEKSPIKLRHSWVPLVFLLVTLYRNQEIVSLSMPEAVLGLGIAFLSFFPLFVWASRKQREQPAFQCFCAIHFPYYAYPILTCKSDYMRYPEGIRLTAAATVLVYLLVANVIYHSGFKLPDLQAMRVDREYRGLSQSRARNLFTFMLMVWLAYVILSSFGYLSDIMGSLKLDSWRNVVRTFAMANGTLGMWFLFRSIGERRITGTHASFVICIVAMGMFVSLSSGFLVDGLVTLIVVTISYTLGRGKVPWLLIVGGLSVFSFLNLGKGEMRQVFWRRGPPTLSASMIYDIHSVWIPASWNVLVNGDKYRDREDRSLLNRGSLIQIQARVVSLTPEPVGYLWGETYSYIPAALVPRFIWKNKPTAQAPTHLLGVRYRLTTSGNTRATTVTIGILAEAWANFGWLGVIALAVSIGVAMRYMAVLLYTAHEYSIRSMLSVVWITLSFEVGWTLSTWLAIIVQSLFALFVILYPLTTRMKPSFKRAVYGTSYSV